MKKQDVQVALNPNDDEAIATMLAAHPGLLDVTRAECDAAIKACRDLDRYQSPHTWITWRAEQVRARIRDAQRSGASERGVAVASFREFRQATAELKDVAERWRRARNMEDLKGLSRELDHQVALDDARKRLAMSPPPPTPFDARGFVTMLAQRGVVMVIDGEGGMTAMPASKLTDQDRATIHGNRSAIAEAVSALTEVF